MSGIFSNNPHVRGTRSLGHLLYDWCRCIDRQSLTEDRDCCRHLKPSDKAMAQDWSKLHQVSAACGLTRCSWRIQLTDVNSLGLGLGLNTVTLMNAYTSQEKHTQIDRHVLHDHRRGIEEEAGHYSIPVSIVVVVWIHRHEVASSKWELWKRQLVLYSIQLRLNLLCSQLAWFWLRAVCDELESMKWMSTAQELTCIDIVIEIRIHEENKYQVDKEIRVNCVNLTQLRVDILSLFQNIEWSQVRHQIRFHNIRYSDDIARPVEPWMNWMAAYKNSDQLAIFRIAERHAHIMRYRYKYCTYIFIGMVDT